MMRKIARWDILFTLAALSVVLFAFPSEYLSQFPNIQKYSGIATAVFFVALVPCVTIKAFEKRMPDNDLSRIAVVMMSVLMFIGVLSLLGIAYDISMQYAIVWPIIGVAVSVSFMMVFYWRASKAARLASLRVKQMSANWLKCIMMIMATLVMMIMSVNYATQAITGMDFFPMPDAYRAPLIAILFVTGYAVISKTERQVDKAMTYLNN